MFCDWHHTLRMLWKCANSPRGFKRVVFICLLFILLGSGAIDIRHEKLGYGSNLRMEVTSAPSSIGLLTTAICKMMTCSWCVPKLICAEVNEIFRNLCRSSFTRLEVDALKRAAYLFWTPAWMIRSISRFVTQRREIFGWDRFFQTVVLYSYTEAIFWLSEHQF